MNEALALGSDRRSSELSRATCRMASVEAAAEHERILREIESTDTNCIGPTLRWVPSLAASTLSRSKGAELSASLSGREVRLAPKL